MFEDLPIVRQKVEYWDLDRWLVTQLTSLLHSSGITYCLGSL